MMTDNGDDQGSSGRSTGPGWPVALGLATLAGTLAMACMMPFVALATLAFATMDRARAVVTIGALWAVNQGLGFGLLGYPMTGHAVVWGLAIGIAALAAGLVARAVIGTVGGDRRDFAALPMLAGFGAAFVAYEGLLFGFALVAGGTQTFAPAIVARILANDALWFAGLVALHHLLKRAVPAWFAGAPAARSA